MATIGAVSPPKREGRTAYLRDLWDRRDFTLHLARGNLIARNAETGLGRWWFVLNPLLMSAVYFLVFGVIISGTDRSSGDFLGYLIVGVLTFRLLSLGLTGSAGLILSNAKLIVNLRFPRLVLPIAAVIEAMVAFVVSLAMVYVLVTPMTCVQDALNVTRTVGGETIDAVCTVPTYRLALLPIPILLLGLFTLGIGALVARWVVPRRDVRNLIPHFTRIWFYLSPVLWGIERLSKQSDLLVAVIKANPMYSFLSLFRTALLNYEFEPVALAWATGWTIVVLLWGVRSFVRSEDQMARYL